MQMWRVPAARPFLPAPFPSVRADCRWDETDCRKGSALSQAKGNINGFAIINLVCVHCGFNLIHIRPELDATVCADGQLPGWHQLSRLCFCTQLYLGLRFLTMS